MSAWLASASPNRSGIDVMERGDLDGAVGEDGAGFAHHLLDLVGRTVRSSRRRPPSRSGSRRSSRLISLSTFDAVDLRAGGATPSASRRPRRRPRSGSKARIGSGGRVARPASAILICTKGIVLITSRSPTRGHHRALPCAGGLWPWRSGAAGAAAWSWRSRQIAIVCARPARFGDLRRRGELLAAVERCKQARRPSTRSR